MKINPYIQVQQTYSTKKIGNVGKTANIGHGTDGVVISNFGKEIQVAKQAVAAAPDVREDVTAPVKEAIKKGTYEVAGATFAEKLLKAAGEA